MRAADQVEKSFGALAEVDIRLGHPVRFNHAESTAQMAPVLDRVSAGENAIVIKPVMDAEHFSHFANQIPALPVAGPPGSAPFIGAPSQVLPYFDPVTIAEAAAEETLKFLLNSKRLARISRQSALDPNQLSVAELIKVEKKLSRSKNEVDQYLAGSIEKEA
jgi:metal-dependent amidase/aminoacylase/carboxypeptidase family protein